jgi:Family of unknown function (DUF5335)
MQNLHLEQRDWQRLLDQISRAETAPKVTIEIDREDLGAQREVEAAVLYGLSYDPKGGAIAIRAGAVEHMIARPQRMDAAHSGSNLICLEVVGADKTKHLISFAPPVDLPDLLALVQR